MGAPGEVLMGAPMGDLEENAAIVNALQRRPDVVVWKSIAEGFGLTVAEAMWKARPVIASRIAGIRDQIILAEAGSWREAQQRVCDEFLAAHSLMQYHDLIARLRR